jgi:hypothetical protein
MTSHSQGDWLMAICACGYRGMLCAVACILCWELSLPGQVASPSRYHDRQYLALAAMAYSSLYLWMLS